MSMDDLLIGNIEGKEDKRVSIKDILSIIFDKKGIEQQTVLSNQNINAIIKMQALNNYIERTYKFKFEIFTKLIDDKRLNIISLNGRGRTDIIESIQAMQENRIEIPEKKGLL